MIVSVTKSLKYFETRPDQIMNNSYKCVHHDNLTHTDNTEQSNPGLELVFMIYSEFSKTDVGDVGDGLVLPRIMCIGW